VVLNDGRRLDYSPKRLSGVEVFRSEQRKFAAGDRIQFRAPEQALGLANGEFATIVTIDERTARICTEDGRIVPTQTVYATSITATPRPRTQARVQPPIA
jgi:hypothetical protein